MKSNPKTDPKWCPWCKQHLPRGKFYRDAKAPDKHRLYCKACWDRNARMRFLVKAIPRIGERLRAMQREFALIVDGGTWIPPKKLAAMEPNAKEQEA
jgi:ribosomal protein L44E